MPVEDVISVMQGHQGQAEATTDARRFLGTQLYLATPCYGCQMTSDFAGSLLGLQAACPRVGLEIMFDFVGNESLVERARNILVARFLKSKCTHLLFVDSDIAFAPEAVFRLLERDVDVATGVYSKKMHDWDLIKRKLQDGETEPVHQMGLDFNINVHSSSEVTNGFVKVLDSATGFMLIKRKVLEDMCAMYEPELSCVNDLQGHDIDKYVAIFACMIDPVSRRFLSEDYSFCRRYQAMGGDIWADVASPLTHIGTTAYRGDIRQRFRSGNNIAGTPQSTTTRA